MLILGVNGSYDDAVKDAENIAIMNGMELGPEKYQKQSKRPDSTAGVMRLTRSDDGRTTIIGRSTSSGEDPTIEIQIKIKIKIKIKIQMHRKSLISHTLLRKDTTQKKVNTFQKSKNRMKTPIKSLQIKDVI
jgi:hypothetical protein